jgi:hypothetical protein
MSLRNTVFAGLIVGRPLDRTEFSLAGHAAFKLVADFAGGALFERIGTTARYQRTSKENQDRQGPHLPILGSALVNASVVAALVSSAEIK